MFTIEELNIMGAAVQQLDIKGSDAIAVAQVLSKINTVATQLDKEEKEKQKQKEELLEKNSKNK